MRQIDARWSGRSVRLPRILNRLGTRASPCEASHKDAEAAGFVEFYL